MDLKNHKHARYGFGAGGPDKLRVGVMLVLLVVVTSLFFYTQSTSKKGVDGPRPGDEFQPVAEENAEPASDVQLEELNGVSDSTREERAVLEADPLLHLLFEANKSVAGDYRRMNARTLTPELYDEVDADATAFRGAPMIAKASVTAIRQERVATDLGQGGAGSELEYWTVLAHDQGGRAFLFSMLNEPEGVEEADVIRMEGFFLKRRAWFASEDPNSLVDPALQLVGKRVVPSFYRMDAITRIDMDLMDTVVDYEIEDKLQIEEEALYHALSFLQNTPAGEIAPYAKDVTSAQLRNDPPRFRGRPVRVLGTFYGDTWGRQLGPEGENPLDLPSVRHGLLVHGGPSFTYLIAAEQEPDWVEPGQPVIVQGIFLKRYVYQTQGGKAEDCPLLIVSRYEPYEVSSEGIANFPAYVITGIGVLFLGWFLFSAFGDRRATKAYRKRYYEARRRQMKQSFGSSEEPVA